MPDFAGQRRALLISIGVLVAAVPISIVVAFITDNYLNALYVIVGVTAFLMVMFLPDWPWLNMNKVEWRPDEDAKDAEKEAEPAPAPRKERWKKK